MSTPILQVRDLGKSYPSAEGPLSVLHGVSFELARGESCAILGPSGSGKTTLLGLCAGLDRPSEGEVILGGQSLGGMSEDALSAMRNQMVGFVFQSFQLLPTLTAIENVMVPVELRGERPADAADRATDLLRRVGLEDRLHHYPVQLSGGEQQRVALARAFVHEPAVMFADEPTGNLDGATSERVEELLFGLNRDRGASLVLVTHDEELAHRAGRVIRLRAGAVVADELVA
jgi:putative ABC transport system ATP-binding protein